MILDTVQTGDLTLGYRELGSGPPVLLVHGWPTSSFLWRNVMVPIAECNRVIALDLPGFGASDKPLHTHYGFEYFSAAIDGFLEALGVGHVALGAHDLGGPIAIHWALHNPQRVNRIVLLNTLVYPQFSDEVTEFVRTARTPGQREGLTSDDGLAQVMRVGLANEDNLTEDLLHAVTRPFATYDDRRALADAGVGLERRGFEEIERRLPFMDIPIGIVYGVQDRILPDVAKTVTRIQADLPATTVIPLEDCGHFVQEDAPQHVGRLLADLFAGSHKRHLRNSSASTSWVSALMAPRSSTR